MKYMKRAKIYKASNVTFDPETCQAYSYDWWRFVDRINGKVVFNDFSYSLTTCRHQSKVRGLLRQLGIEINLYVECPKGLQERGALEGAIRRYNNQIESLRAAIAKPRSREKTNFDRLHSISSLQRKIVSIEQLLKGA